MEKTNKIPICAQVDVKAREISELARKSISSFCMEECKAYCCRKGYLVLNNDQIELVTQGKSGELYQKKLLKHIKNKKTSLFLGGLETGCLCLKDFKCTIHNDSNRPHACKDFPLFLDKKLIRLSPRCLAVKDNMFYPYISQLIKLGYKLKKESELADIEFYNLNIGK